MNEIGLHGVTCRGVGYPGEAIDARRDHGDVPRRQGRGRRKNGIADGQALFGPEYSYLATSFQVFSSQRPGGLFMAEGFIGITVERCKGCGFCNDTLRAAANLPSAWSSYAGDEPHEIKLRFGKRRSSYPHRGRPGIDA